MRWIRGTKTDDSGDSITDNGYESGHFRSRAYTQLISWGLIVVAIPLVCASFVPG